MEREPKMHFGTFLIRNGAATQEQILDALNRQRRAAPFIGEVAVTSGVLDVEQVLDVLDHQTASRLHFAEQARVLGYISDEQALDLRRRQKAEFVPLGEILVDVGVLTRPRMIALLREFLEREKKPTLVG